MHLRFAFPLAFLCLALLTEQVARSDPPLKNNAESRAGVPVRLDRYGDPLPPGVVARLGTERLTLGDRGSELTFSPDGRRLATYDHADQLRIWDVSSGKELLRIKEQPRRWHGRLVYSPDGKTLAMGYGDQAAGTGKVCVWEAATGKELHRLGGRFGQNLPSSLCFSPDGRSLFAGGHERPLLCWDLAGDGTPRKIGDFSSAPFVALSRDGRSVTAGRPEGQDGKKWIFARWDTASGKEIGQQRLTVVPYWGGALSPDGGIFARPVEDGKSITLFDPMTGREISRARGCHYPVAITFSADGSVMTCRSKDGIVHIWDTATGKVQARFQALSTSIDYIVFSPDGKRLALTGRADHAIHVWDVAAGRELHSFAGHRSGPLTLAFLKGGKEIATVSRDASHSTPMLEWADWSLRRWDVATGVERAVTKDNPKGEVYFTVFSPDGRRLATVVSDGTLRLWDVEAGKVLRSWKVPTREQTTIWKDEKKGDKVFKTPNPTITEPFFSPDGKMISAAHIFKIHRWEVATGRELPTIEVEGIDSRNYSWCLPSPDGRTLLVWSVGGRPPPVLLVDATNGKVRHRLAVIRGQPNWSAFSPDGRTLALEENSKVSLWEVASGRSRGRLPEVRGAWGLAFSPDGRFLVVGAGAESFVSLWDLATSRVVGRLPNDFGRVQTLAFSPDSSRLAVAGYFPTVLVCDVAELCGKKTMEEITKSDVPSAEELEGLWAELAGADGARAYRAIRRLGLSGSRGAAFLKARLQSDKSPDERRIAQLIADLDNDQFAKREKASAELEKLGSQAEPALRRTLESQPSAEVRSRVKRLLDRLGATHEPPPSAQLVRLRVVEALEANGNDVAREALAELAKGSTDDLLMREAKASLARLRSRRGQP